MSPAVLLPLAAAMLYALAALFLNAAARSGVSGRLSTAVCNLFLFFLLLPSWDRGMSSEEISWVPVLSLGSMFFLGQVFTLLAFSHGEVSTAAPVMGLKVLFVAVILAVGLREPLPSMLWVAAFLSVLGVAALQFNPGYTGPRKKSGLSIGLALLSGLFFAVADIQIQYWSPSVGFERLIPPSILVASLLAWVFALPDLSSLRRLPRPAGSGLLPGAVLLAVQSYLLVIAIGRYGQVAQANILYSSRGIWGVLAVWGFGHWVANVEFAENARTRLVWRLTGALLITIAIVLTLLADNG